MKILAIRGKNLASLEGTFEVVLAEGPLAEAGVFAICGPTGAGKSTLLDTMCLALYDTAPRLDGRSRVRVGREGEDEGDRLTTSDPRSLLRKGSGEGYAEVDFEGVDAHAYRARWEVRRARNHPEGKLQATTMALSELGTDRRWEGRKTDVKEAIEARLGLSFDQFRRSVLLAQGDFAAFLDADAKDRADLLERMTGTAIYGAISAEAHARAGREKRALELVEERLVAIALLPDDARDALASRAEELAIAVRQCELATRDAEAAVRWHHQREALLAEEREAEEAKASIERQLAVWETRRRELEGIEAALPLRPLFVALERACAAQDERATALAASREESTAAQEAAMRAAEVVREANEALTLEESRRELTRRAIEHARRLDRELEGLSTQLTQARTRHESASKELRSVEARQAELELGIGARRAEAEGHEAWLAAHPETATLAEDWSRTEDRLGRLASLIEECRAIEASLLEARIACDRAGRVEAAAVGRLLGLERTRRERQAEWEEASAAARRTPSDALSGVREKWVARRTRLETLVGVADAAQEAFEAERRHRARAERAEHAATAAEGTASQAARERERTALRLDEAEAQRDRMRATLDLESRRAELEEGQACPLCGSSDHPYAREAPAVRAIFEDADARLRALRVEHTRLEGRVAEARKEAAAERAVFEEVSEEARAWHEKLSRARTRYRETARELGTGQSEAWPEELPTSAPTAASNAAAKDWGPLFAPVVVEEEESGPMLSAQAREGLGQARVEAIEQLEEVERAFGERRERERQAELARSRWEEAAQVERAARREHEVASRVLDRATHEFTVLARDRDRRLTERTREEEHLDPALHPWDADWRSRMDADPQAVGASLREAVEARRSRARAGAAARAEEAKGLVMRDRLEAEKTALARDADQKAHDLDLVAREEARARAERAEVLSGSVHDAEARSLEALQAAKAALERAGHAKEEAVRRDVEARATSERAASAQKEQGEARRDAEKRLEAALAETGLDRALARARLAHDEAEIDAWRRELRDLDRARSEQDTVLAERTRKRESHEATAPPPLGADEARAQAHMHRERLGETRELLHSVRARLEQDESNRNRAAEIQAEVEKARRAVNVWLALADLIGSANGSKLRVFAQSLTLELLLEHANHHLRELAPRYGLSRVPGENLALQVVDHEMGGEVRAVGSLSGGESFLVALGMALGLASLSSQKARVDSLFIDEGFGALDPLSLETVLATLDTLQASGRQVGLVSHVPTVAERFETRVQVVAAGPARSRVELIERFAP